MTNHVPGEQNKVSMGIGATPFEYRDPVTIPRRQFLFGRHAVRKFVSVTAAAGGTGKTALAMAESIAFAVNRDLLNDHLVGSGRSWYIGLEDPLEEYERRVGAILLHHRIAESEISGGFFLDSGRDQDFIIARETRNGIAIAKPIIEKIIDEVTVNEIVHVTVDPFIACHSIAENDNSGIEQVARQWADIADKTGAAIELVHHIRKLNAGEEISADAARGAKALTDAARSVRLLTGMTKEEADKLGIAERRRYFRVTNGKANLHLPPDEATWRQLITVSLGNGGQFPHDLIQVAAAWSPPRPTDGVSGAQVEKIRATLGLGEHRANAQADAWAGYAVADVLGLDLDKTSDKARVKALLQLWVKNGALAKVWRKDANRQEREFIVPTPSVQHLEKV